jgi:hypothetical protein
VNTLRHNYYYENGKRVRTESAKWDTDSFKLYMKTFYEFYEDGKSKYEKMEELLAGVWTQRYDMTYTYDKDSSEIIWFSYSNGNKASGYRWRKMYNEFGNVAIEYQDGWSIDHWVYAFRTINYYWQSNQRLAEYILERYKDDQWTKSTKMEFGYNSNEDVASETSFGYVDSVWKKSLMRDYQYDSLRNLTVSTWNTWDGENWKNFDNTINIKFTLGNLDYFRYLSGYRFEFTYDRLVSVEDESNLTAISPNPAKDYIEITVPALAMELGDLASVRIYDILGVEQLPRPVGHPFMLEGEVLCIDVSSLSPGVYFVMIGKEIMKFVKL